MNSGEATYVKIFRLAVVAACFATLALVMVVSPARADTEIGSPGTGAGETRDPRGVDVDEADDLLYVADRGNNRIDVFDASSGVFIRAFGWGVLDGASELEVCTTTCLPGLAGSGAGQLKEIQGIAVDNDPTSSAFHGIYVHDVGNHRIQRFTPAGDFVWTAGDGVNVTTGGDLCTKASGDVCGPGVAGDAAGQLNTPEGDTMDVGPSGTVYVGDRVEKKSRVQMWSPAGAYLGLLGGKLLEVTGGMGDTRALAVDSAGSVYVGTANEFGTGAVRKYDPSGNELVAFNPSFNVHTIAAGPEDHVFVGDNSQVEGETVSTIYEYSSAGTLLRAIYGSLRDRTFGLAVYSNPNGDLFAVELGIGGNKKILDVKFPPPGPLVYPKESTLVPDPLRNRSATLRGKVNPEGEVTTYHFEYISDADYKAAGETFGAGTISTPEASLPADFQLHPVKAELTGLLTETVYHFRIIVKSSATGPAGNIGPVVTFETRPALEIDGVWSSHVGTATATLNANVNPAGIPATARFEYVELSEFESSGWSNAQTAPVGQEIDLGEGEAFFHISASVGDLKPGTPYRFRVVGTDRCRPEPAPLCEFKSEATFTTFLPLNPLVGCPNDSLRAAGSGAFLPDCRGYEMVSPVDKNGSFIEPVYNVSGFPAGLDQVAANGNSVTYSAYKAFGEVEGAPYTNQYLSRRSSDGWQTEGISPEREGPSLMTYNSAELDRQYQAFSADLCNGWVVQDARPVLAPGGIDGYPGLYRRDTCDVGSGDYEALTTEEPPNLPPRKFIPRVQGISADSSVAIFAANDNLTSGLPDQPVSCQTGADPAKESCLAHLYEAREGTLRYVCVLPDDSPYANACQAGSSGDQAARNVSNAISDDGSRIFWSAAEGEETGPLYVRIDNSLPSAKTVEISSSSSAQFWTAAADGSVAIYSVGGELFEYDVDAEAENPIAGGMIGFAGASEDASRVYFASTELLTDDEENSEGEKAAAGKPNLYLYEAGSGFTFVGRLIDSDLTSALQQSGPVARSPVARLSQVSPDGQRLAFMSSAELTGYDSLDSEIDQPAMEVFLYDAAADRLLCPSCNPTGARPEGRQLTQKRLEQRFVAARIPPFQSPLYISHVFSADGARFYFDSFDALSVRDTNKEEDVYQWQAPGSGSCTTASPTYHEVSGGCLDLISSGQSSEGSELVDISSNGDNVFFKTNESLVTQDPALRDIYDARVGGGFPPLPPKPEICQGEKCPKPPASVPPASNPGSQSAGPGNPPSPKQKRKKCPKGKHKVKKGGKVRCVKNKKHKAKKRAGSNRRVAR